MREDEASIKTNEDNTKLLMSISSTIMRGNEEKRRTITRSVVVNIKNIHKKNEESIKFMRT